MPNQGKVKRKVMEKERIVSHWKHFCWLLPKIRGICRDRQGIFYWIVVAPYGVHRNRFTVSLIRWPGCTAFYRSAGWLSIGPVTDQSTWTIFDIQVPWNYKHRGLGTALVRAATKLAQRQGISQVCGEIIQSDFEESPFLPTWYTKLGFTVNMVQKAGEMIQKTDWGLETIATFHMELEPKSSNIHL